LAVRPPAATSLTLPEDDIDEDIPDESLTPLPVYAPVDDLAEESLHEVAERQAKAAAAQDEQVETAPVPAPAVTVVAAPAVVAAEEKSGAPAATAGADAAEAERKWAEYRARRQNVAKAVVEVGTSGLARAPAPSWCVA
jgi:hypothetical protein